MLAIVLTLLLPIIPIFIAERYNNNREMSKGEKILRYVIYITLLIFASSIILGTMKDDNTSVFQKVNQSIGFALKFAGLEIVIIIGMTAAEWLLLGKRLAEKCNWDKIRSTKFVCFLNKFICPYLIYVLAAFVIIMNVSLIFDHVVWGDEAFSTTTAKKSLFGIMQVLYYWDNHPPLHYYWIKLFGDLFGHTIPVYHVASLIPFLGGIILAVTAFRKRFGNIPTAFFVMVSGLGAACLEYNLEIRMYSLAFCGVLMTFYYSYNVISTGKKSAWVGMVLWALEAAYSHYYALVVVGILLFCTSVAIWLKYRGKTWLKGFAAIVIFLIGYTPWLFFLFTAMKNVSGNWWMTDILGLDLSLNMVMGGNGMSTYIFPLLLFLIAVLLLAESSIFRFEQKDGQKIVHIQKPSVGGWSDETYSVVVGMFTIIGTLSFAYLLCYVMRPMIAERYMYPLSAVALATLMIASSRAVALLKKLGDNVCMNCMEVAGKAVLIVFLAIFFVIGIRNYNIYSDMVWEQEAKTCETLELIGEPEEDIQMVTNGVKHLGWTVLEHYYPDNEIVNGDYGNAQSDKFWYFSPYALNEQEILYLQQQGFEITYHGEMQLSQYSFELYYMAKQ